MNEQAKARQEACCNASETEYFGARPQIDTLMQRHSFCAGFYRGYDAAIAATPPAQERIDALEPAGGGAAKEYAELPVWIIIEGDYYRIPNNILESIKAFADATHALRTASRAGSFFGGRPRLEMFDDHEDANTDHSPQTRRPAC